MFLLFSRFETISNRILPEQPTTAPPSPPRQPGWCFGAKDREGTWSCETSTSSTFSWQVWYSWDNFAGNIWENLGTWELFRRAGVISPKVLCFDLAYMIRRSTNIPIPSTNSCPWVGDNLDNHEQSGSLYTRKKDGQCTVVYPLFYLNRFNFSWR